MLLLVSLRLQLSPKTPPPTLSHTYARAHAKKKKSKVIGVFTAGSPYILFFKVAHFVFLTDTIVPLITFQPIS